MNIHEKSPKSSSLLKTLHTTLACLVATSAFALDDRFDNPKPDNELEPEPRDIPEVVQLPDLVPLDFDFTLESVGDFFRHYKVTALVGNFGKADAAEFYCHYGMRVLETTDPVKYPVGFTDYVGLIKYDDGLKAGDMAEPTGNWMGLYVPNEVSKVEIYLVVDRNWDYLSGDLGDWTDDAGKELEASVKEIKETNNVSAPKLRYYYEYQEPEIEISIPKGILAKPKGRE